jgi:amino acid transporter/nucleotide-binding universal stress UspA family protein
VLGSLLLLADFIVTAAMSCWDGMSYFHVPTEWIKVATIACILVIGAINYYGPKHSGSFALFLALPMVVVVLAIIGLSAPYMTLSHMEPPHESFFTNWVAFCGVILALSGVEAIANLTGVMKLDPGSTSDQPKVNKTATKSILPVAIEVVAGTALLGWAMLSVPHLQQDELSRRYQDMLRYLGEYYGEMNLGPEFGHGFGIVIGIVVGLLLVSAVNTAVSAMIGLIYMLARDREMPDSFTKLNSHGVPIFPMVLAIGFPIVLVIISKNMHALADMYAIGVVGAIAVNLGSCAFNKKLGLRVWEKAFLFITFILLFAVELTIAHTKPAALFFAVCVIGTGFALRWAAMKRAGLETVTLTREVAAAVSPEKLAAFRINLDEGQTIMVAARGNTPVLRYALEEARLRKGTLYVLFVKELAVSLPGPLANTDRPRWQDDSTAAEIMYPMIQLGRENDVPVVPIYVVSENPAATILDLAATLGVDILALGSPHRLRLVSLLKGNVVTEVARSLPENIQLIIHG